MIKLNNKKAYSISYIFNILALFALIIMPITTSAEYGSYFSSYNSGASNNQNNYYESNYGYNSQTLNTGGYFSSYAINETSNNQNNYYTGNYNNPASNNAVGYFSSYNSVASNNTQTSSNQNNYPPSTSGYFSSYSSAPVIYSSESSNASNSNSVNTTETNTTSHTPSQFSGNKSFFSSYGSNLATTTTQTTTDATLNSGAVASNNSGDSGASIVNLSENGSNMQNPSGFVSEGAVLSVVNSPTKPDCGKYYLYQVPFGGGFRCYRFATYSWLVAGQGWNSEVNIKASSESKNGVYFEIGLGDATYPGLAYGGFSSFGVFGGIATALQSGVSKVLKIFGPGIANCNGTTVSTCFKANELITGTLFVRASAPDIATLEAATSNITYKHFLDNGALDWQVSAPITYNDLASNKWNANIAGISSNNSSFAVTNLSTRAQSVLVSVYDKDGKIIASSFTPTLFAGIKGGIFSEELTAGGVYSATLSDFFKKDVFSTSSGEPFQGTIRFEGADGGNIVPLVMGSTDSSSMSSFEAVPESDTGN